MKVVRSLLGAASLVLVLGLVLGPVTARAETAAVPAPEASSPTRGAGVALLGPARPSPELAKTLSLLRGELSSLGLAVALFVREDAPAGADAGAGAAVDLGPWAARGFEVVMDVRGGEELQTVALWLREKGEPPRFERMRVDADPSEPRRAELAVLRVVEALRGGWLALDGKSVPRTDATTPAATLPAARSEVSVEMRQAPPDSFPPLGFELGAEALVGLRGLGPALSPTVALLWSFGTHLDLGAQAMGWGTRAAITANDARAEVAAQQVLLGLRRRWRPVHRVWPFLGVAGGLMHTEVVGEEGPERIGHRDSRWSGVLDLNGGSGLRLSSATYLAVAVHAQLAAPYLAVVLRDQVAATLGRPDLLFTLVLGARL